MSYGQALPISMIQGNPALTARVQGYLRDQGLKWMKIAPPVATDSIRNFYYVVPYAYGRTVVNTTRDPSGRARRSKPFVQQSSFTLREDVIATPALKSEIDQALKSPQGFQRLLSLLKTNPALDVGLSLEARTAAFVQDNGNYIDPSNQVMTLSAGSYWDEGTSTPAKDVADLAAVIFQKSGKLLNQLCFYVPYSVHLALLTNSDVVSKFNQISKATSAELDDEAKMKSYFGVKEYGVLGAVKITSNIEAATEVSANVWGQSGYLFARDDNATQELADGAWFTPTSSGLVIPVIRTYHEDDPEGDVFEAGCWSCTAAGAPDDEAGVRAAGRIDDLLST